MTSNVISSTLNNKDITELPLAGRNAFTFARLVPGAVAPAGTGSTHFNGMPGGTINPTIDGVNNSSNGFKSGGTSFFGTVPARLGAIEEVTVESAGLGGDAGVDGRREPEVRHAARHQPVSRQHVRAVPHREAQRQQLRQHIARTAEGRAAPPRLRRQLRRSDADRARWRDKLFFFANYEQEYIPQTPDAHADAADDQKRSRASSATRRRPASSARRTCSTIAGANGFAVDARIRSSPTMLAKQTARAAVGGTVDASTNNLRTEQLTWLEPQKQINYYPTARIDYQIKPNLSFMGSYNRYNQDAQGRRVWPFPDYPINSTRSTPAGGSLDRPELDDQPEHAQRVPLRHPAQRRHERGRPRARDLSS